MRKFLVILLLFVGIAAHAQTLHTATIKWTASTSTAVTSYNIYRGLCNGTVVSTQCSLEGTPSLVGTVTASTLTYLDTPLTANTSYYWFLTAVINTPTTFGESSPSTHWAGTTGKDTATPNPPGGVTGQIN